MKVGIVGLPNAGKSSLFNLLTDAHAQVAKFPFTTIDRNFGMAAIPDERLIRIHEMTKSPKLKHASIEFVDIAGLIKGASKGEGLGNQFLAHIRDVDLIVHVLRCFSDVEVPHSDDVVDPARDYDIVRAELFLADLEITERRLSKIKKNFEMKTEVDKLNNIREELNKGNVPSETVPDLPLLTNKPEITVLNYDEDGKFKCQLNGYRLSVKLEEDIIDFSEEERSALRKDAGLEESGLEGLMERCLRALEIIFFYTIKGDETHAWPVKAGTKVIDAAGMIHTDMKKGFIKAEILSYQDFGKSRDFVKAQQAGRTKIEGREYLVQDGDIIFVKFRS